MSHQVGGDGAGVENFLDVESGECVGVDWDSILGGDSKRVYRVGKKRRGRRGQAANLDAAAAGDLDNAVAEFLRRRAKRGECR